MTSPLVSRSTTVAVEQERAFDLFVGRLGDFKPPEHNLLATPIAETVFEPWVGGSILDRSAEGPSAAGAASSRSTARTASSSVGTSGPPGSS